MPLGVHLFFTVDLIFGIVSAMVAFLVAYQALRGYILTNDRTSLFFSSSFILITVGLLSRTLFDYLARFELTYARGTFALIHATPLLSWLLFASVFFVTAGYVFLIALFFKIRSKLVIALLVVLSGLLVAFSNDFYYQVHLIPAILLFFIQMHTFGNFFRKKTRSTLLVFASFALLFLSELSFLMINYSITFYFFGNMLRLVGYLLLLANLFLVLKR